MFKFILAPAALILAATLSTTNANAGGLFDAVGDLVGGVTDVVEDVVGGVGDAVNEGLGGSGGSGGGGLIGDSDSGALITLGGGDAGSSGTVNLGLGGGSGNLVDANILPRGNDRNLVNANVSTGRNGGLVNANVGLLNNNVRANVGIGGSSLLDFAIGIGGRGTAPRNPGGPGGPGVPGGPGGAIGGGGGGGASVAGGACTGASDGQVLQAFNNTRIDARAWSRASGVQVVPIRVCPDVRNRIAVQIHSSNKGNHLTRTVASDALITTSLSRTSYNASRVFSVMPQGNQLMVYVY